MRITRNRALLLAATLSLGTFAFSQAAEAQTGSLTGEFENSAVNAVANYSSNVATTVGEDPALTADNFGSQTGEFEGSNDNLSQPAIVGATANVLAAAPVESFSGLTGEFEASGERQYTDVQAGSLSATSGSSQPGSMGSNADNEDSGAASSGAGARE